MMLCDVNKSSYVPHLQVQAVLTKESVASLSMTPENAVKFPSTSLTSF